MKLGVEWCHTHQVWCVVTEANDCIFSSEKIVPALRYRRENNEESK